MASKIYAYKGQFWKVIHDFQYTGEIVPFTLDPGKYLLICHGANGGNTHSSLSSNVINYGGVAMGVLDIGETTQLYAVVGGNGGSYVDKSTPGTGGFNGGGNGGKSYNNEYVTGAGGGGASDIRLMDDDGSTVELSDGSSVNKSLLSRIIVAGGGGGSMNIPYSNGFPNYVGNGGGAVGGYSSMSSSGVNSKLYASQSSGYAFGKGMDAPDKTGSQNCGSEGASGGGGGWYGGYACGSTDLSYSSSNGGGGSGYVLTSDSFKPEGYLVGEEYYLTDTFLDGGSATQPCIMVCAPAKAMYVGDAITFPCIGETEHVLLPIGKYMIECYGGDGGCRYNAKASARGGYARGTLNNSEPSEIFVNVGGSGIGNGLLSSGSWSVMNHPTLMFNGGGAPGSTSDIKCCAGGGASDVRVGTDSLYARIIVAGGAGGMGAEGTTGGAGGGTTGGTCTSTNKSYGENAGPGTQTSSPQSSSYPQISGKFGYGGNGVYRSDGYGGAGGGGWYGGSGTYPDSSGDDDKAGSGGSGYVLTSDSYKPEGYLVGEEYYLDNTLLVTGGNTLPLGHTQITMKVMDVSLVKMIAHDEEGFKRFDSTSGTWVYLSSELTEEDFENYGVYNMNTDEGLLNNYQIYVFDKDDLVDTVISEVSPSKQTITTIADTSMLVSDFTVDATYDSENFDIEISSKRKGIAEDSQLVLNVDITKKVDTDENLRMYAVYAMSMGTTTSSNRYIPPKSPSEPDIDDTVTKKYLLKVGTRNGVPIYYKQYLTTLNGSPVTSVQSVVACEHDRVLYIAMVLNDTTVRLQKINMLTNKSSIIRDIPRSELDNYYYGGLLVDDNYLYLTSSDNDNKRTLYRIDLKDPLGVINRFTPGNDAAYNFTSFGKMEWYNDNTIIIDYKNGFMLFDTETTRFTTKSYSSKSNSRWDMSVGKSVALSHYNGTGTTTIYVCEIENNSWSSITLPGSGQSCSCYDGNGKFYIAQTSNLVVWDEETKTIEQTVGIPWTNPNTVHYSKGIVYATIKGSNQLWMYNTKTKIFNMISLQWTTPSMSGTAVRRPAVFDGYIFIPYLKLGIISYLDPIKYNLGYKYDQYKFLFNKDTESEFTYDDRFVTFRDGSMYVHNGEIINSFESYPDMLGVKFIQMNKSEYKKLISVKFDKRNNL